MKKRRPAVSPYLGPVEDLERHLPSDWWRTLFNALYLKTDGDVVENPENTQQEIDSVIEITGVEPDDAVLDLCCGQGRHAIELARRGFTNVAGLDRSRYLVRLARKRARTLGFSVNFYEGDARKIRRFEKAFTGVICMGNSFGYFEHQADDQRVVQNVYRILTPGGRFMLDVVDGEWMRENFERRSWEWIDGNHFVCRERSLSTDGQRIITRELINHAEKGTIADQFYAERLYTREQLTDLLRNAGFEAITFHEPLQTVSTRGQDLGMLTHRFLVSARVPIRRFAAAPVRVPFRNITVLLGDPSLPDRVKKDGVFGNEDIETIRKMTEALADLKDFEFRYWDKHENLITELAVNRPEFVLNLCDEGFNNDAFKELHVPALLELLDVPYTGAGPACLGLCYNKSLVNAIARSLDIPVPMETYIGQDDSVATLPSAFPALIKPCFGDSSMGITQNAYVDEGDQLIEYVEWLRKTYGRGPILVQEFLSGTEYSVGIVGNPGLYYRVLPVIEVDYSNLDSGLVPILGYESKWIPDSPWWNKITYRKARPRDTVIRQIIDHSNTLFEHLGCRDYARFDFRMDAEGTVKLLEVNPNPGWCWDGKMNIMAGLDDMTYSELLESIIRAGQERVMSAPSS